MRSIYVIAIGCLVGFSACNGSGSNGTAGSDSTKNAAPAPKLTTASKLSENGTTMLMTVVTKYYNLKNSLVATKSDAAGSAATALTAAADSLQAFLAKDSANKINLKPYLDTIITQSQAITSLKDETCEKQRLSFGTISSAMYGRLKTADLKNGRIYHEYCPMAFNDKGAFWLSDESEIKNPYFGKKMMECGEVTDSL